MLRFFVDVVLVAAKIPLKKIIIEAVSEVMVEFALDNPRAGGAYLCCKCDEETLHGICPECQPMVYARLSE